MTSMKLPASTDKPASKTSKLDSQASHVLKSTVNTNSKTAQLNYQGTNSNVSSPAEQTSVAQSPVKDNSTTLPSNAVLLPVKMLINTPSTSANLSKTDDSFNQKPAIVTITIEGNNFQFKANEQIIKLIQMGAKGLLSTDSISQLQNIVSHKINTSSQQLSAQLVLVSQAIKLNLPTEIVNLAQSNGVTSQQLLALATRPQGYPLPLVELNANRLMFENGTNVIVSPLTKLPSGLNLATVTQLAGQLQLSLSPIKLIDNVSLSPTNNVPVTQVKPQLGNMVFSKHEPVQLLTQYLKNLERIPLVNEKSPYLVGNKPITSELNRQLPQNINALVQQPFTAQRLEQLSQQLIQQLAHQNNGHNSLTKSQFKQLQTLVNQNLLKPESVLAEKQVNEVKLLISKLNPSPLTSELRKPGGTVKSPFEVLNQNLSKAGAMPIQKATSEVQQNLASQLIKLIPSLDLSPLTELANPSLLKAELKSLTSLNLAQTTPANINLSGGAITTLFQLLLGFKLTANNTSISPRLQSYMAKLQQKIAKPASLAPQLLSALDKAGSLESMGKLASSISLYQQSSDANQNLTWYFALPYSIGQRDEQLEGKFEKQPGEDNEDKQQNWRLQLKFNLAQGPILVMAHKQGEYLDLTFTGNDTQVLSKVEQFQASLMDKIKQAGLQAREISTLVDHVPPTLLPGDHYLVKTNA
ncbi:hypothetical protein Q4601_09575 [Shewanella sp. 1_MG-2023]|uniref:hypothetical protein n=1 Tax=unclassified Shewanella TaxID=196818 RepID=UPI0026E1EDA7|nr:MULTISPECIES: hypothetical protein [unclassified Shewanella]MDO6612512.1 hypothetical protein [Shewanella sp. 7_MG-2023]MDO6772447.1 hypothetical protein [Shewanella sp. 2_MG-2023]MDO6794555.1 hypothetical protein [Shewanella sp. 1_MG-2023]